MVEQLDDAASSGNRNLDRGAEMVSLLDGVKGQRVINGRNLFLKAIWIWKVYRRNRSVEYIY